ncbi:hypothetical protein GJ496_011037, partial [Pomphorhynchus laevis]
NSILVPDIEDTAKHVENLEKENDDVEKLTYTQPQKTSLIKRKFGNNYLKPVNPVHLPDDDTSKMVGSTSKIYETCSAQTKRAERREVHISHILVAAKNLNRYSKVKFIRLTCNDLHIADGMDETEVTVMISQTQSAASYNCRSKNKDASTQTSESIKTDKVKKKKKSIKQNFDYAGFPYMT